MIDGYQFISNYDYESKNNKKSHIYRMYRYGFYK